MTTDREAFAGTWVRRGLVMRPIVPEPDADETGEMLVGVLTLILKQGRPYIVTGTSCADCGCLIRPDELCPACVRPWMYAQEKAFNERRPVVYYRPTTRKDVAA